MLFACLAQSDYYQPVFPMHKGSVEVGCIVAADKKGEIVDIFVPRSIVFQHLDDTAIISKTMIENLPSYSRKEASDNTSLNPKLPEIIDVVLKQSDIKGDSVGLLSVHKESLVEGARAKTRLKKDKRGAKLIEETIENNIEKHYHNLSLVTSVIYADAGIVRTDKVKSRQATATADFIPGKPSISFRDSIREGEIMVTLVPNSPVLYHGEPLYKKQSILTPLGIKQFQTERPWDIVRGSIYALGTVGGFIGAAGYGYKWATCDKPATSPFLEEMNSENARYDADIKKYQDGFWICVGVMAGSYGLNVLDNFVFCKSVKGQKFVLSPIISPRYNEICLIYNF
ncbi:hypothetical protein AGMMS49965_14530 [Bacteroidia bacterium]|nr:hypothetical protein AGMMS49965_14530 [Bacteroidia bacterium]